VKHELVDLVGEAVVPRSRVMLRKRLVPRPETPYWVPFSVVLNVVLLVILLSSASHDRRSESVLPVKVALQAHSQLPGDLNLRQRLSYQDWLAILRQEAQAMADQPPKRLAVLLGDSLSLWFPKDFLPGDRTWLNQGISGETSGGLLRRLYFLDRTRPEVIFLMIGINDLLSGVDNATLLDNERQIIRYLRQVHPDTRLVVQSILPHAAEQATWAGRDRFRYVTNDRIHQLNRQLAQIAEAEGAEFLDLSSLFSNRRGALNIDLSTDGLHLNDQGYWLWRLTLHVHDRIHTPADNKMAIPWDSYIFGQGQAGAMNLEPVQQRLSTSSF